jgi:aldose 1-epimerase
VKVHHTINNENQWQIKYEGISDKDTLFDPTNHVYFNLNKENRDILNHKLKVKANYYVPVDENTLPLNNGETVSGNVFNFKKGQVLSSVLNSDNDQIKLMEGIDHAFVLSHSESSADVCLENVENPIKVKMKTDRPAVVIFTHNKELENKKHHGITMEAQSLPDSINIEAYKDKVILRKNEKFVSTTTYTFYNE